ncbi:DUF4301 family protein [uncultured Duncaniella sp.]|mgnify:CR=1 FL=1|uniref:DUF4301 family protein n=1 Tax=uncultured Duncaniella sp. TaxID=2768039 RepID=UPI0025EA508F|nr:DUF4301 family protein [uncultured Duncaniella sp.]
MLRPEDLELLKNKGISAAEVEAQLQRFVTGFPYLKINDAARVGAGIFRLDDEEIEAALERWKEYLEHGGEVCKFVPASGAASRMFKALFEYVDGGTDELKEGTPVAKLLADVDKLPFLPELRATVEKLYGKSLDDMLAEGRNRDIIAAIVNPEGMNYGGLPKGLLKFHTYPEGSRTPIEEHLTEGAQTAANSKGVVNLHFTVSANHRKLFEEKLAEVIPATEKRTGVKFNVSMSEQKPSTDTIAVNPDNTPFMEDGHLLFRPGGHGALIQNLNDMESAVVFIKNIDNVVPDSKRGDTVRFKEVLGGLLLQVHDQIEEDLIAIDEKLYSADDIKRMLDYLNNVLNVRDAKLEEMDDDAVVAYIRAKLDRPLRVCGMVRNEGEPGGGPFIAFNPDGSTSPQILESNQVDPKNEEYMKMMASATHFNPVDLVCYIKDIHGKKFDLPKYVDPATGFISSKSSHGKELRAMELPGLWNGAMSDWNTVFVEVPISTFNPVKTVNDLLRPAHQQ